MDAMDLDEFAASREERWERLLDAWHERKTSGHLDKISFEEMQGIRQASNETYCAFGMLSATRLAREFPLERVEASVRSQVDAKLDALLARTTCGRATG
jgi:hypothetical protein